MIGNVENWTPGVGCNVAMLLGKRRLLKCQSQLVSSIPSSPAGVRLRCGGAASSSPRGLSVLAGLPSEHPLTPSNLTITTRTASGVEGLGMLTRGPNALPLDNIDLAPLIEDSCDDCPSKAKVKTASTLPLDHPQYIGSRFDAAKPPYSYACLIAEAILNSPEQHLLLPFIL